jgi:hypothetical protein
LWIFSLHDVVVNEVTFGEPSVDGSLSYIITVLNATDGDNNDGMETDTTEISAVEYFGRADIASLDNNHPSIVVFAGCDCGLQSSPNSVGKELLHTGGVATISSSGNVVYVLLGMMRTIAPIFNSTPLSVERTVDWVFSFVNN